MIQTPIHSIISVITVVYNGVSHIEKTIKSVIEQTYPNLEYIIIDGGSTDGTIEIVKKYIGRIAYFISEKDKGIYDAMNKGIQVSTGDWINFVNAGDTYSDNEVLAAVNAKINSAEGIDILYGNSIICKNGEEVKKRISGLNPKQQWKGPIFRHGAMFICSNLQKQFLYKVNPKYKICADFDLIYHMFVLNKRFNRINRTILKYEEEGVSSDKIKCAIDNRMVVLSYTNKNQYKIWHWFLIVKAKITYKLIFPITKSLATNKH